MEKHRNLRWQSQYIHYIDMNADSAAHKLIEQFPVLRQGLYANHAAIAPWPRVASQAVKEFAEENCTRGPLAYAHWLMRETQLRQNLARLLNARSTDDIALLKNTTEGICTVANGLDWQRGDNLVIPLDEFPSNRLPWLALQHQGVEIKEVDIRSTAEPEQALLARLDGRTRLLSVSAVQWTDGLRLQLATLGAACQKNDVLFFVDAIQQLGAMQMDVQACRIDCLAADGHKWMLGPEGIAVFYCRQAVRERLQLSQHGWRMVDEPYQFNRTDWQATRTAARFEAGSPNLLGQVALHASVGLLLETGMAEIETRITANSMTLANGLSAMQGIELVRPYDAHRASGIVSFRTPARDPAEVYRALARRKLVCALRGDAIRLSPHFYQSLRNLHEMLGIIETVI